MARRGRGPSREEPDSYERAAERINANRRSRELGDPIPALEPVLAPPLPDRRRMRRTLYLIVAALVVLIVGRLTVRSHAPTLAASCTKVQIALEPITVRQGGGVSWSATGPSSRAITVTIGSKQVSRAGTALSGCKATGKFLVQLGPGHYDVTLREGPAGTGSATARFTVKD